MLSGGKADQDVIDVSFKNFGQPLMLKGTELLAICLFFFNTLLEKGRAYCFGDTFTSRIYLTLDLKET